MRHQILSAYFLRILLSDFLQKGKVLTVGSENQFASNFKSNKHYERMLLKKWQNSRWMPGINLEISYDIEFKSTVREIMLLGRVNDTNSKCPI